MTHLNNASSTPRHLLERIFTAKRMQKKWFAPQFLHRVPHPMLRQAIVDLVGTHGKSCGVRHEGGRWLVQFEHGQLPVKLTFNQSDQITSLLFGTFIPYAKDLDEALSAWSELSGQIGLLVLENGQERGALNPDVVFAVGSAFKIAVLAALRKQIQSGNRDWTEIVALRPEWKTLPAGILHDWPDNAPLTLFTLAALMISRSDNTATDALIEIVGRTDVERFAPHSRPLLTTREAFVLKDPENKDLLERFREADTNRRRDVLAATRDRPLPAIETPAAWTPLPEVEWFFTPRELCRLMKSVAPLPLMGINPGLAEREDWHNVAFKAGSDVGVFSLTTWVEAKDGRRCCVAAVQNDDSPLDPDPLYTAYAGLLRVLA
jgi:Beta-lactamase enzyme family